MNVGVQRESGGLTIQSSLVYWRWWHHCSQAAQNLVVSMWAWVNCPTSLTWGITCRTMTSYKEHRKMSHPVSHKSLAVLMFSHIFIAQCVYGKVSIYTLMYAPLYHTCMGVLAFSHLYESKDMFLHNQSTIIKFRKFSIDIILLPNWKIIFEIHWLFQSCSLLLFSPVSGPVTRVTHFIQLSCLFHHLEPGFH